MVEKHWVAPSSTQTFILQKSTKWVPGTPGDLVVKDKLFPSIGYAGGVIKFILNNGNNPYSISRTAPIPEYLKKHDTCFVYTVDL